MLKRWLDLAFIVALISAVLLTLWRNAAVPPPVFAPSEYQALATTTATPVFAQQFLPGVAAAPVVHSATIIALPNGHLLAAWFGGSREGAADVAIYAAERVAKTWSQARIIADRVSSARALGRSLRKLGNPVLIQDRSGRIWLFFVITSLGGWSTSAIAYQTSTDGGQTFSSARILVTSPLLNLSTLVRTRTLLYTDGSLALPAYHELLGKFGLLIRIAPDGRLLSIASIGGGRSAIQPSLVATAPSKVLALLRRTGTSPHRVLLASSANSGSTWSRPQATDLLNPDASIAVIAAPGGGLLLAYNPSEQNRNILSLARSTDGLHWQHWRNLEHGAMGTEFSYPSLICDSFGTYHLVYTWQRRHIAYLQFNTAWLEQTP